MIIKQNKQNKPKQIYRNKINLTNSIRSINVNFIQLFKFIFLRQLQHIWGFYQQSI